MIETQKAATAAAISGLAEGSRSVCNFPRNVRCMYTRNPKSRSADSEQRSAAAVVTEPDSCLARTRFTDTPRRKRQFRQPLKTKPKAKNTACCNAKHCRMPFQRRQNAESSLLPVWRRRRLFRQSPPVLVKKGKTEQNGFLSLIGNFTTRSKGGSETAEGLGSGERKQEEGEIAVNGSVVGEGVGRGRCMGGEMRLELLFREYGEGRRGGIVVVGVWARHVFVLMVFGHVTCLC